MSDQLIREAPSKYAMRLLGCLFLMSLILIPTSGIGYTDRIVAVVNKEVITWLDLQNESQDEYSRLKAKYRGEELERRYRLKQREVLNALIVEHLQLQEAKAKGISVTQEEIDAAIRRTPLSPNQTEEEFSKSLLLKKLFDFEVRRNVVVEEEELRRYYEANPNNFRTPPQYRLKQIFLTAQDEIARLRAKTRVEEKDLVDPLAQALKELTPGTLSKPIDTQVGVHLLIVEEIKEPQPYPFEQVERVIHAQLLKQRSEEAYNEWMNRLKQQAFVDVKF
jgi:parvulin-like peptidyl-prolyl isomerase